MESEIGKSVAGRSFSNRDVWRHNSQRDLDPTTGVLEPT